MAFPFRQTFRFDRSISLFPAIAFAIALAFFSHANTACADIVSEGEKDVAYELQPYRVRVAVAFANDARLPGHFRKAMLEQLSAAIERSTGGQWDFVVEESSEIAPVSRIGLERLLSKNFAQQPVEEDKAFTEPKFDKQYFLTLRLAGAKYVAAGREWDEVTQELGPVAVAETFKRSAVPETLCHLLSELFQPLLVVEQADIARKTLSLKLRAGAYIPETIAEDATANGLRVQIKKGSVLVAFFRYHNKDGSVREVQFLPWTYLVVDSVTRGRVAATLVSGIRTPLGAKTSKRVHSLAIAKRAMHPATTLEIQLRNNPRKKLAGHYVTASKERFPEKDEKLPEIFHRLTDRLGRLEIPVEEGLDILWLRIHSGNALLALVPFAPGFEAEVILDLPDDSIRLAVEGDLVQVNAELVNTVAQRAGLMIRIRKYAEKDDWKNVDEQIKKLDKLPSLAEFRKRVSGILVSARNDARAQKSRLTENRVKEMCDTASNLVEKYLSEERIDQLKEDIRAQKAGG